MEPDREESASQEEGAMKKGREPKEDGRYIIFYWFELDERGEE